MGRCSKTPAELLEMAIIQVLQQTKELARGEDGILLAEVLWAGVHGVLSLKVIYPAFPTNSTELLVNKMINTLLKGLH